MQKMDGMNYAPVSQLHMDPVVEPLSLIHI